MVRRAKIAFWTGVISILDFFINRLMPIKLTELEKEKARERMIELQAEIAKLAGEHLIPYISAIHGPGGMTAATVGTKEDLSRLTLGLAYEVGAHLFKKG